MTARLMLFACAIVACDHDERPAPATARMPLELCALDDVDLAVLPPLPSTSALSGRLPATMCDEDRCLWQESDDVYGVPVAREDSWWAHDGFIYRGKERVALRGLNWFGFETVDVAPHGLWADRTVEDYLDQMVSLGFDALRLPLAPEAFRQGFVLPEWAQSDGVETARDLLLYILTESERRQMHVLLDLHTCGHGMVPRPGSPLACEGYTLQSWLDDLGLLADIAASHPNVVGIDLFNEPSDLLWGEWADLASRGARAVLQRNPRVLVFVQGVSWRSAGAAYDTTGGEALTHAGVYPPDIPASRLVYAPHIYGPDIFPLNYLASNQYPAVLQHVWDLRFGHLFTAGHALVIGEFGGHYDDSVVPGGVDWQNRFVDWMRARGIDSFFYWAWNPNSGDTGGILGDDWETPIGAKLQLLAPLLAD